jgi:HEXXH motif-containing protein
LDIFVDIERRMPTAPDLMADARSVMHGVGLLKLLDSAIDMVIPVDRDKITGVSTHYARGAVFIGFFGSLSVEDLVLGLAHELAHQIVMVFESADPLIASSLEEPVYSGVRGTLRPAIQALHAGAALFFMSWVSANIVEINPPNLTVVKRFAGELGSMQKKLELTVRALRDKCKLTEFGERLICDFESVL